ncbi:MAG: N-acetylmuramoyl-L-alanine amidase [Myxococcota bacterium]
MRARGWLLLLAAPLLLGVNRPSGLADVDDVRFWSYPDYTRVVVEVSGSVPSELELKRLGADARAGRPQRLYVDLPEVWVGRRFEQGVPVADGLLRGVRLGQNTLRRTRVVLDLERYSHHRLLVLRSPHRLVIDVYGKRSSPETLSWPERNRGVVGPLSRLPLPARRIRTVVLDPGHGGRDPGAIGVDGLREKDVNLRLAHKLAPRLEAAGFRVVMTRDDDTTLSLEERTAIAESEGGDLFVSLHANASRRRSSRGFEIYYLDESVERHSLRVAARENGVAKSEMDQLQRTLAQLRVGELSRYANRLAGFVHDEIAHDLADRHGGFQDLGVKKGPFYVLFLSSIPSILIETGFVTNGGDARLLRDEAFLESLATRIALGLSRYRDVPVDVAAGGAG